MDRENLKNVFPRLIDFGTLDIGESITRQNPIKCKIPLDFEYEFEFLREHDEIKIEPMKGKIPGLS